MASPAYQNNGVIIIWWDETEGGDDASRAIRRIRHLAAGQGQRLRQLSGVEPFFRPQNDGRNFRSAERQQSHSGKRDQQLWRF